VKRPGARELARQAMRAQVSDMAFDLFVERGYEETTVEDICAVAGISRSTFFRYFPTKEDVLMAEAANSAERALTALRERPAGESPWTSLRCAMVPAIAHYDSGSDRGLKLIRLVRATPVLATHQRQDKVPTWLALLGPELARRLGVDPDDATDPRPMALVAGALGCLDAALLAWAAGDGKEPLTEILDRAMDSVSG
jgi:AcrR family transcriptional regulator